MFYVIEDDGIRVVDKEAFDRGDNSICILKTEEWEKEEAIKERYGIQYEKPQIHFCKMESHISYMYATIVVPPKNSSCNKKFAFYLLREKIIFIDDSGYVLESFNEINKNRFRKGYTLQRFLHDFLLTLIEDDILYLQSIEQKINELEEGILNKDYTGFNEKMLHIKKKITKFYHYYNQMTEVGQELVENETDFFEQDDLKMFDRFMDRAARLAGEMVMLREYAMQVQDVYQSEIGLRQNDIMKVLTVVTTIFLPLTLIAGWYGMNFVNMPELTYQYSYPIIIGISLFIVIFGLVLFKKKKFW